MKLLYITTKLSGAGGMQRVVADKANTFSKSGYDISILCTNPDGEAVIYELSTSVKYGSISPVKGINYFLSYRRLLKKHISAINPDIIIMCDNGLKSFLLPFIASKKYKLVYEMHGSKYIWDATIKTAFFRKILYHFMDFAAANFDKFIVLTASAKAEWPLKNITVIPNYLWFENAVQSNLASKIAIAVGRHVPEKGYDRLLTAWKLITEKYPDWQLHIYGNPNPEHDVKKMAEQMGLLQNVSFFNPVKNIQEAYTSSSLCLVASRSEGFGMALLEAMACGVPCVAFDCPVGPRDIIENGKNGFLIADGDVSAFASSVIKIINDKTFRIQMGQNAISASGRYNREGVIEHWKNLFKNLTNL